MIKLLIVLWLRVNVEIQIINNYNKIVNVKYIMKKQEITILSNRLINLQTVNF